MVLTQSPMEWMWKLVGKYPSALASYVRSPHTCKPAPTDEKIPEAGSANLLINAFVYGFLFPVSCP